MTFQCRNFLKADPSREVMLDVSSTSSDSDENMFVSPLTQLNAAEKNKERKKKSKKKKSSESSRKKKKIKEKEEQEQAP